MNKEEIKKQYLEVMEISDVAYLATVDSDGFPQIRAMANLRNAAINPSAARVFKGHENDFLTYFTTHKSSDKMKHIKSNPSASVYFYDSSQRCGVLVTGRLEIVSDARLKKDLWEQRWIKHFPRGSDDPEYTVLRLVPAFVKVWSSEGLSRFELSQG